MARGVAIMLGMGMVVAASAGCERPPALPLRSHDRTVPEWVAALHDRDPKQRRRAVAALGHVGAADPAVVPALTGALKDGDAAVRDAAVLTLLALGPAARDAAPALEAAQKDRDPKVRDHATRALAKVRPAD